MITDIETKCPKCGTDVPENVKPLVGGLVRANLAPSAAEALMRDYPDNPRCSGCGMPISWWVTSDAE